MSDEQETTPTGIDRRTFMKSSAVVGGLVWAAPAMSTFGARAFAGTPLNLCPPGAGQPSGLQFRYTGRGCEGTTSPQFDDPDLIGGIVFCKDFEEYPEVPSGGGELTLEITGGPDSGTYTVDPLNINDTFFSPPTGGKGGANTVFTLRKDGVKLHEVGFHTSCSEPLRIGDNFGSFALIDGVEG